MRIALDSPLPRLRRDKSGESRYQNYILTQVTGKEYVYKGETRKPVLRDTAQPGFRQRRYTSPPPSRCFHLYFQNRIAR